MGEGNSVWEREGARSKGERRALPVVSPTKEVKNLVHEVLLMEGGEGTEGTPSCTGCWGGFPGPFLSPSEFNKNNGARYAVYGHIQGGASSEEKEKKRVRREARNGTLSSVCDANFTKARLTWLVDRGE